MNTPTNMQPASFWRRTAARAIDALVTTVMAVVIFIPASGIAFLMAGGLMMDNVGPFITALGLLLVPVLTLVARYEVAFTARRGQTFGKGLAEIRVVQCGESGAPTGDPQPPELLHSLARWAIPHGAGLLVGVVASLVAVPRIKDYGGYVGVGAGVAVWAMVYASSLFDKDRRGWHDKAARTIVVVGGELERVDSEDPDRSPPAGRQDSAKRASDPAAPEAASQGEESSYGLVSDYYAPVPRRPPPDRDDTRT